MSTKGNQDTSHVVYPAFDGAPLSEDYRLFAGGKEVPVFQTCSRYGPDISFAYFDIAEGMSVSLDVDVLWGEPVRVEALPAKYGIAARIDRARVTFEVSHTETYVTLVVNGDYRNRPFHIFVNGLDEWGVQAGDPDVIYFGPGYHELPLGEHIELSSGQTLYLAGGAWVNAPVLIRAGSTDVRVCGHGVLAPDQIYDTRRVRGLQVDPGCSRIRIEGIVMNKRVTGWCGVLIHSRDIEIENYKVVTGAIWSTDGMNPVNCTNVSFRNCFIRCGDDTIAVKGFRSFGVRNDPADDPVESPPNEHIIVESCILWSDNNNAVVLGQETKAAFYRDIHFRDCDILYVNDASDRQAALALICLDGTSYSDISFRDIRIGCLQRNLITMFFTEEIFDIYGSQRWSGSMKQIAFSNITVDAPGRSAIRILGWDHRNRIDDVMLDDVVINGESLCEDGAPHLVVNEFVTGLTIRKKGGKT